jgi:heme/copper-type cytochrome/quinol oxidase subunit 2
VRGKNRLLEVDHCLVIDHLGKIAFNISSADVIHSFALPSLGVKIDAVPGAENRVVLDFKQPGIFYGQCSELCGVNHTLIPIIVVVTDEIVCESITNILNTPCLKCGGSGIERHRTTSIVDNF